MMREKNILEASDNNDKNRVLYKLTRSLDLLEIKKFDEDSKIELLTVVDGTLNYLENYKKYNALENYRHF